MERTIKSCEVCAGSRQKDVLDLGSHPLCDDLAPDREIRPEMSRSLLNYMRADVAGTNVTRPSWRGRATGLIVMRSW